MHSTSTLPQAFHVYLGIVFSKSFISHIFFSANAVWCQVNQQIALGPSAILGKLFYCSSIVGRASAPLGLFAAWDLVKRRSLEVPEAKQ